MKKQKKSFVRDQLPAILIPVFAVLLSLIAISIIFLLMKKNPFEAFDSFLQGAGLAPKANYAAHKSMLTDFMSLLNSWTPLLFAALAVAVAFKAGLFNISVSGQMLFAGFMATILVGYSNLPAGIAKPLVIVIGMLAGALVGIFIGFLRAVFNINEVVSSIMINYILQGVVGFLIKEHYVNPVSRQSREVSAASRLTLMNHDVGDLKMDIPIGIIIGIVCAFIIWFLLNRTRMGFEIKTVGMNPKAANYAGIHVKQNIVLAMGISGALAGLAGVTQYLGYVGSIQPDVLSSIGFDSIAVSLLGNSNPIGIIFASFLISIFTKGSTQMNSTMGVATEISSLIIGLILLFSSCTTVMRLWLAEKMEKHDEKKEEQQHTPSNDDEPVKAKSSQGGV